MTDEERENFRAAALEYLRDDDAVTEPHVQKRIADEIERLAAENDWLRTALRAAQIGAGLAPTRPDDKSGDSNANPGQ
jgi:hypothetical protein